jgi:hypothetical protein
MNHAIPLCLSLVLAACSGEPGGPSPEPPAPEAGSADDNVIGAPLQQSLDKARSVEDLGGQRKGGLDEAIDEAN